MALLLPAHIQPYVGNDGKPTKEFYNYLKRFTDDVAALESQVAALQAVINGMTTPVTVASLGSASPAGQRKFASDVAPAIGFASVAGGGGTTPLPVYSDGTTWREG